MFESLTASLQKVFSRWGKDRQLTEENIRSGLEEIRLALLEADVHYQVARDLVAQVTERSVGQEVVAAVSPADQIIKIFSDVLTEAMQGEAPGIPHKSGTPAVVMMVGLQGSGKTTTTAKLAKRLQKAGRRPMLVAADVRRPAAIHQLQVLGEQLHVPVFSQDGEEPPAICAAAVQEAQQKGCDVLLLDTAGRLHIDEPLMQELTDIAARCKPDVSYLVVDAMAGQDAYASARDFHGRLHLDGLILTKLDGDTRGGAAISVRKVTEKPVAYLGMGELLDDLDEFHADRMASRILGMGDVVSLVEKAQEVMDQDEAEEAAERLLKNQFSFQDFLSQLRMLKNMGPLSGLLKMLPGGLGQAFGGADGVDEKEMGRVEAIILSMTEQERLRPDVIDASRKRRIARGSGTEVSMVNQLIRQFDQMRTMMKSLGGGGGGLLGKMGKMLGGGLAGGLPGLGGKGGGAMPDPSMLGKDEMIRKLRGQGQLVAGPKDEQAKVAARKERKRQKQSRKRNRKRR